MSVRNNNSSHQLRSENQRLRDSLAEARETLLAIRNGDVDAVVVNGGRGQKVYTLQDSENLYRHLADSIREPLLALDSDSNIVFFNHRLQELVALPPTRIAGQKLRQLIAREDQVKLDGLLRRTRVTGFARGRISLRSATGTTPIYWRANSLKREDGKLICLVGTDLSDLEAIEQNVQKLEEQREQLVTTQKELEDSRERYAQLYNSSPVGHLTLTLTGLIDDVNPAAMQLFGQPRTKLMGCPLVCQFARSNYRKILKHLSRCRILGEQTVGQFELLDRHGQTKFVELITKPYKHLNQPRIGAILVDVTARRKSELALRESEERFRNMADSTPILVCILDLEKRPTYVNKSWLGFTGRTLKQELAESWATNVHPDDREHFVAVCNSAFDARKKFTVEYRFKRRDRQYRWILAHGAPYFDPANNFLGYIGSCIDITERKRMESALIIAGRIQEENPAPVIRLLQGRYVGFSNPAAGEVLTFWKIETGDEPPKSVVRLARQALANNVKSDHDLTIGKKSFQLSFAPIRDGGYVNVYFSDITERKRAERILRRTHAELERRVAQRTSQLSRSNTVLITEMAAHRRAARALTESEERLRMIIEGTPDYAIFLLDSQGRVATWNAGAEHIKGYRAKEVLGRHFSRFYPYEDILNGKPDRLLRIAKKNGRAEDEGWRVRKNGTEFWANVISTALHDKERHLRGYLQIVRDITEHRQAQEVLMASEKRLADFFDEAPLAFLWVGRNGHLRRINNAGADLLGYDAKDCLEQPVRKFFVDPRACADIFKRLGKREIIQNQQMRFRRPDGAVRHVLIDANGLWESGRMVHSRWFVRDVTRRVELEREIMVVAEHERQRIGRDLHDDLCQQLTGIEFLSHTLVGQFAHPQPGKADRVREITQMVRKAIVHTRELARGLSPVELERHGLRGALLELAGRTRRTFRVGCRIHGVRIRLNLSPALSIHLYRIAQEAVTNAIKHGKAQSIDIHLKQSGKRLTLSVKDNGCGIPKNMREGKGMGLRAMRYRAGVINGNLTIEPNPTGGTIVICSVNDAFVNPEPNSKS